MSDEIKKEFSYSRGVVRDKESGYFILTNDELADKQIPHAVVFAYQRGTLYNAGRLKWDAAAACFCRQPQEQLVVVGVFGQAYVRGSGDEHNETILSGTPGTRARIRCATAIDGKAHVAGMDRCVFRRDDRDNWTPIDRGTRLAAGSDDVVGFESLDGLSSRDIYGVGWGGEIWHYDGVTWQQVDSPVNTILTGVCCAGDKEVYACGRLGTLLVGEKDRWMVVEHQSTEKDIWGLAWFNNHLYVSTLRAVYTLERGELQTVDFGSDIPRTCYQLSVADGVLWSIGAKDVMAFNGREWARIV